MIKIIKLDLKFNVSVKFMWYIYTCYKNSKFNHCSSRCSSKKCPNKKIIFKNCAPFINSIKRINNTQVDEAHDIDVVKPMYSLIEYSDNYSKASGISWQYCIDELAVHLDGNIDDFNAASSTTNSFKIMVQIMKKWYNENI